MGLQAANPIKTLQT